MEKQQLRKIIEGALLAYGQPLTLDKLYSLFVTESTETAEGDELPTKAQVEKDDILAALEEIQQSCEDNGFELKKVSSGWRFQVKEETAQWVNKLWEEKPQRYSRALMETLAIIAYRQPITRGDIEEIRGVAVSSNIIKTLSEREWVKVVGQRDVPGRPSLYATTKQFLDYFNLSSLEELPSLKELTDIDSLTPELDLTDGTTPEGETPVSQDEQPLVGEESSASEEPLAHEEPSARQEPSEHQELPTDAAFTADSGDALLVDTEPSIASDELPETEPNSQTEQSTDDEATQDSPVANDGNDPEQVIH